MRDNLLKEAIADAKTVRDTALANARLTLEEAFKPHLASMLSTRLRNEVEGDGDEMNEMQDTSGIGGGSVTVKNPGPTEPSKASSASSHIENPGQEEETLGKGNIEKKPLTEDAIDGDPDQTDDSIPSIAHGADELGMGGGQDGMGGEEDIGAESPEDIGATDDGIADTPDELDLEAIIRELEKDVHDEGDVGAPEIGQTDPVQTPRVESFKDADAGEYVDGAFDGGTPMQHKRVTETLAGKPGDGSDHDGKSPTSVDGVPGGKKVTPGKEVTGSKEETMTEEVDLDEILREVEAEDDAMTERAETIATENVDLKRSLREHREVIQLLRGKLQEVNILNAKLLYTNRLFKGFTLGENQKLHIVESFDRATTLREVKLIYATLAESLKGKLGSKKGRVVTEGLASKSVGSTKPKSEAAKQTILAEGTDMVARLQKLAGIKA
jgi:hypothetical protein